MSTVTKPETKSKSPVVITATWDGVRHWLNAGKLFEQGKLFSQVMTGFELLALHKKHGVVSGRHVLSHDGKGADDWETILQKEAGLSQSTAYRYMDMAKAAAPRLRKLPALKDFDPFSMSLAKLGEPQREALSTAVKKLTDGKSQGDFFEELYKSGGKSAGRDAGCDNTRTKLSLSEEAALRQKLARKRWASIAKQLRAYRDMFTVLTPEENEAQQADLDYISEPLKAWIKQPLNKREPKAIAEMFQGGAK